MVYKLLSNVDYVVINSIAAKLIQFGGYDFRIRDIQTKHDMINYIAAIYNRHNITIFYVLTAAERTAVLQANRLITDVRRNVALQLFRAVIMDIKIPHRFRDTIFGHVCRNIVSYTAVFVIVVAAIAVSLALII